MVPYVLIIQIQIDTIHIVNPQIKSSLHTSSISMRSFVALAVQEAEVAVPSQRDHIDNQNTMVQGNQLEVDSLNKWPNHPVGGQCSPVGAVELLLRAWPLHNCHAAQETEQVGAGEDGLIGCYSGCNFEVLVGKDDLVLEKLEPSCCSWTKDCYKTKDISSVSILIVTLNIYLRHTTPFVLFVRAHGSSIPASLPTVVPWYPRLQRAPPLLHSVSRVGAMPASFDTWSIIRTKFCKLADRPRYRYPLRKEYSHNLTLIRAYKT